MTKRLAVMEEQSEGQTILLYMEDSVLCVCNSSSFEAKGHTAQSLLQASVNVKRINWYTRSGENIGRIVVLDEDALREEAAKLGVRVL